MPYMGYIGMCRCEGFGFHEVYLLEDRVYKSERFGRFLVQNDSSLFLLYLSHRGRLMNFLTRSILQEFVVFSYSMLNKQNNNSAKLP